MRSSRYLLIIPFILLAVGCSQNSASPTADRRFNEELCRESKRPGLDSKVAATLSRFCDSSVPGMVPSKLIFHHEPTIQATIAHCFADDVIACDILAKACPDLGGVGWCSDETASRPRRARGARRRLTAGPARRAFI